MDPSSGLSVDEVVRVYQRWFRTAPRGFAMLSCKGEPARREFLDRLRGRINEFRFVDLSRENDAQSVVESMVSAVEACDAVVFFGFEEALAATPENARLLNFNRERLASSRARQLWVVGPVWRRALLTLAFDLYSWFLPNTELGVVSHDLQSLDLHQPEDAERKTPGPAPSAAARRSARSLLDRFERIYHGEGEVNWGFLNGALDSLRLAGDYPESHNLLDRAFKVISDLRSKFKEDSPEALRDLFVSLLKVGDVQLALAQRDQALASYEESLGIRRRLLESYGDSPVALRDVSVSLNKVGDVQLALAQRDQALASYEESLGICRRLLESYGDSPEALRDVSVSLNKVGDVQWDLGQRDQALASYEESLGIRRRLLESYGDSPEALRDVSVSLNKVGDVQLALAQRDQALASYEESLGICRRLLESYGDSPEALRDVSVSLNKVGDVQLALAQRDQALASYEESLGICRRLLESYGDSPEALRDLSVSLERVGDVQWDLGQRDQALASYEESLGISRRLLESYGDSPEAVRDLAISCGRMASLLGVGNEDRQLRLAEANEAMERAIAKYGKLPDLLEIRQWLQGLA